MAYYWEFSNTPAGRVLRAIQLRGRASIKDVATDLGVTPSAVRPHLTRLGASGAVQADRVKEGVGRPHYVYSLTPEAHNLFHNDYADLVRILLQEVSQTLGADTLRVLLRRVADRLADIYRKQVWGQELADRVEAWAGLLDRRGVSAIVTQTEEGYALQAVGCPHYNLAREDRAVCEMELQVMSRVLKSGVSLSQCLLDGHRDCQFAVSDKEPHEMHEMEGS